MSAPAGTAGHALTQRLAARVGGLLAGRGHDRRRFLQRAAVVGTALIVNPLDFVLRPQSAYASVCGPANECSQGWTAMCCTINGGANTCPDGSYAAGWWKVSSSAFCNGADRYVIDCNRLPQSSCSCHCADGPCDRRRVCCNNFRYGQCNQQIAGTTPVVCRIVICTPPWEWDPSCTTTVRSDERTRDHSATCLNPPNPTRIAVRYQDMGLVGSPLGAPVTAEIALLDGAWRGYEHGTITDEDFTSLLALVGPIAVRYRDLDGPDALGWPDGEPQAVGDGRGRRLVFDRGVILHTAETGAWEVPGALAARYDAAGGPLGDLGYPVGAPEVLDAADGQSQRFEGGGIYVSADTGARALNGPLHEAFLARGGPSGFLGLPVTDVEDAPGGRTRVVFASGWALVHDASTQEVRLLDADVVLPDEPGVWPPVREVDRWAGADRIGTAVAVAGGVISGGAPTAVVATAASFADALSGGVRAAVGGGPVLLTRAERLPEDVSIELGRLGPAQVWVVGGVGAVAPDVVDDIRWRLPDAEVTRLSGEDRFATAAEVARTLAAAVRGAGPGLKGPGLEEPGLEEVVLVSGRTFADALPATPLAAARGAAILLTEPTVLPDATRAVLAELAPRRILVVGGAAAVSSSVVQDAADAAGGAQVRRLSGASRVDTAVAVSQETYPGGAEVVVIATGSDFPDALSAGAAASLLNGPLLLVTGDSLSSAVITEIRRLQPARAVIVGGHAVIGEVVAEQLRAIAP